MYKIHLCNRKKNRIPGQPKIIVANHPNSTDAFLLPFIFPDKLHFLILEENFTIPFFGKVLTWADQIPVELGRGREALATAKKILEKDYSVVIFPEGYLTHGRKFRRGGAGAALLACETGIPIIPVGFFIPPEFTHTFRKRFFERKTAGRWQLKGHSYVNIGVPIFASSITGLDNSYRAVRHLTDMIMEEIKNLVHQAMKIAQQ